MKWTQNTPEYGDMIRVKVNFYYHYGIFCDENTVIQFGMRDNGDTSPDEIAVMIADIQSFSGGEFVERGEPERDEKKRKRNPRDIVETALSGVGKKGYNILNNNCEHFVNECYFGEKKSFLDDVRAMIRKKINMK